MIIMTIIMVTFIITIIDGVLLQRRGGVERHAQQRPGELRPAAARLPQGATVQFIFIVIIKLYLSTV
jgi:hypothetical protein